MKSSTQETSVCELRGAGSKFILELRSGTRILQVLPGAMLHIIRPCGLPYSIELRTFYRFKLPEAMGVSVNKDLADRLEFVGSYREGDHIMEIWEEKDAK